MMPIQPEGAMLPGMPERLLSSPFIRWLLTNQEMLNREEVLPYLVALLLSLQQGRSAGIVGPVTPGALNLATMMAPAVPGMSPEEASPQDFRDLPQILPMMLASGVRGRRFS